MILLTGASGFLGTEIKDGLHRRHLEYLTLGRSNVDTIQCDLRTGVPAIPPIGMVIHAAGKAHIVTGSDQTGKDFFSINVQGTRNLLASLQNNLSLKKFVFISSVAVYGLTEGTGITEDVPLLAAEPYGQSKLEAERLVTDWCKTRNVDYYILRLPLVAGKNPPGNLGTMIKAIRCGRYLAVGKGLARKSMILANDVAAFIATINGQSGIYNLTDGYHPCLAELENTIATFCSRKRPFSIPLSAAKILGFTGDIVGSKFPVNSRTLKKITSTLTFDDTRARIHLQWKSNEILKAWMIE